MTEYNIKTGDPTTISTQHNFKSYLFHPYGLSDFRKNILKFVDEKKQKGLSFNGFDNLTNAWRTPWDIHLRYNELLSPLNKLVTSLSKSIQPEFDWYHHDSWIAQYENSSAANLHNHSMVLNWSYCYYVKVPDSGPEFMMKDGVSGNFINLNVCEGDIVFFRSFIDHQVLPSVEDRVVIAGNLKPVQFGMRQLNLDYTNMDTEDWTSDWIYGEVK